MFIDNVSLTLSSGKGGPGCVSFRREKHVIQGGPDGGDGGRGGNVYFQIDRNTHTLSHFRNNQHLKARNGEQGMGKKMYGKSGEHLIVTVPPGTQVLDAETGEVLLDLIDDTDKKLFLEGGIGGLGNTHFKSSTNQRPEFAQQGRPGVTKQVKLELKLIADVGLVGFPNVGKSTLISVVSNAHPEIANYEFTTLTPKLGVVVTDDFRSYVMADIPGIIEGASEGKGLGIEFLRHIERTKFLLFMVDLANYRDLKEQYYTLKQELRKFSEKLALRDYAIALTRCDTLSPEETNEKVDQFLKLLGLEANTFADKYKAREDLHTYCQDVHERERALPFFVMPISSVSKINIDPIKYALSDVITKVRDEKSSC